MIQRKTVNFIPKEYGASDLITQKMIEKEIADQGWDLVKIKCTNEFMRLFFLNGDRHFNIKGGLSDRYKLLGMMQDANNLQFILFFGYGDIPEGRSAREIYPTITDTRALCRL